MASNVIIRTEYTVRYAPAPPRTEEEEKSLVDVVIRQQGAARTVRIAQTLASRLAVEPDRLFLPVLWVEEELKEIMAREPAPVPLGIPEGFGEDGDDDNDTDGNADWEDNGIDEDE